MKFNKLVPNVFYTAVKVGLKTFVDNFQELIHPNTKGILNQPRNAREFALMDDSGVCIVIQEWKK